LVKLNPPKPAQPKDEFPPFPLKTSELTFVPKLPAPPVMLILPLVAVPPEPPIELPVRLYPPPLPPFAVTVVIVCVPDAILE